MVEELLREDWNLNHGSRACELRTELVVVTDCIHRLEQPVIHGATVFNYRIIAETPIVEHVLTDAVPCTTDECVPYNRRRIAPEEEVGVSNAVWTNEPTFPNGVTCIREQE